MNKIRVLVVEDESLIRWSLRSKLESAGYEVTEAESGAAAYEALDHNVFDLILLDYKLPDTTGLDILARMRESEHIDQRDAVVVMITAHSTIERAVDAIKLGAFNFVPKPFDMDQLMLTIEKALETTRLRREVNALRREMKAQFGTDEIIGQHPSMVKLMEVVTRVARSGASTVFLRGETGAGKDMVARALHNQSPRAAQPFVNITCTAISDTLLESELFGHERGAFTDAKAQKKGLFEIADGGTAFLDEIGDMAAPLQAKLLRFLEARRFRRVGGMKEIVVDVRVIAATNRDIEAAIRDGAFREDLLYRLNVVTIDLPSLRERGSDVLLLAEHFAARFAREFKRRVTALDDAAKDKLMSHAWPGNVRELRNVIERAVLLSPGEVIVADDLLLGRDGSGGAHADEFEAFELPTEGFDFEKLRRLEVKLLRSALVRTNNNQTQAAKLLKMSRDRLRYRLQKHGLL